MSLQIKEIKAFVSIGEDGDEGIIAHLHDGVWHPLVCADDMRVEQFRPLAIDIANKAGVTVKLVRFSARTEIETIEPHTLDPRGAARN